MAKRGPKGLGVDLVLMEKLAAIHCTNTEIAAMLGCDHSLLSKPKYSIIIAKGKEKGKLTLRRKMFETAMNGNVTMMIWLSKQLLGFTEPKIEHELGSATQQLIDRCTLVKSEQIVGTQSKDTPST
jgi:hypothetical protein